MQQLRCAGVVAAVTISRVAFPNRLPHETALARFGCLTTISSDGKQPKKATVFGLMKSLLSIFKGEGKKIVDEDAFACGKSRVYFQVGGLGYLEARRVKKLAVLADVFNTPLVKEISGAVTTQQAAAASSNPPPQGTRALSESRYYSDFKFITSIKHF